VPYFIARLVRSITGWPRAGTRSTQLAGASLALLVVLGLVTAATPPAALAASTLAARCDGANLRTRPSTAAKTLRTVSAGTRVVAVAKVAGTRWSVRCGGSSSSGSSWYRISSIGGRSVQALYGVSYVYGAVGLFRTVITTTDVVAACSGVTLRTAAKTTATAKVKLAAGTKVTAYGAVTGGDWRASCPAAVSGDRWYRITKVNGTSVRTLYGVTYLYAARGLFKSDPDTTSPEPPTPAPTPTPTPTPAPTATPTPTPAPTATPAPTPAPTATPSPTPGSGYTEGIDVSHWQGVIDWSRVAAAGKRFAYLKASEDTNFVDGTYTTNRTQAAANGLEVGAYHFARPSTAAGDAVAEADHFVDTATPRSGDLIPVLDLEVTGGLGTADLQAWVRTFLQHVYDRTGVRAAIYVSPNFWSTNMGNSGWFAANGYATLWVAHWTSGPAPTVPASNWGGRGWTFWQYTSSGTVPGISGHVDLDRYRSDDFTPVLVP
jgi:GH25 family lysozyme M1 (1,4-beta-N-acetylmuramidase)